MGQYVSVVIVPKTGSKPADHEIWKTITHKTLHYISKKLIQSSNVGPDKELTF